MAYLFMMQKLTEQKLAKIIKFHRKKTGLSQLELAKLSGVGKTTIFDLEHAKEGVQLNTLLKVLYSLNITIELKSPIMAMFAQQGASDEKG
jgi:HTH-type transcriptional regulator/antitoxin HipB